MSTTCYSPINAISVRRHFVTTFVFLVDGCTICHSAFFRCGHCTYLFASEQNEANIIELGLIFLSNCFEWLSLVWKFASVSYWVIAILNTNISQGSVDAFEVWWDISYCCYCCGRHYDIYDTSVGERILAQLERQSRVTRCILYTPCL